MSLPVPTVIASGLVTAVGSACWQKTDQLLIANSGDGTIAAVTAHTHVMTTPPPG